MFHEPTPTVELAKSKKACEALADIMATYVEIVDSFLPLIEECRETRDPQLIQHLVLGLTVAGELMATIDQSVYHHFEVPECPAIEAQDTSLCESAHRINEATIPFRDRMDDAVTRLRSCIPNPDNN